MNKSPIILILMGSLIIIMGCAKSNWIQSTLVTVDVTGTWQSTEGGFFELELVQQGSRVTGSLRRLGLPPWGSVSGTLEGTVTGDMFRFKQTTGTSNTEGDMTVVGDEMSGRVTPGQIGPRVDVLRRVK